MKTLNNKRVCIIIPAYNESKVIADVINKTRKALGNSEFRNKFHIVVINDASTDSTPQEASSAGAHVISHILNCGAGGATSTGLMYAKKNDFDIAATIDADGQHCPEDLLIGLKSMATGSKSDLLIGSRLIDSTGMSRLKVIGNKGLSLITQLLFGVKSTDSQSGMRIFSKNALDKLYWKTYGYEFCSEMLWRAHQSKLIVEDFPIKAIYTDYSMSKGQSNWNAINIIVSLTKRRIMEIFQ